MKRTGTELISDAINCADEFSVRSRELRHLYALSG